MAKKIDFTRLVTNPIWNGREFNTLQFRGLQPGQKEAVIDFLRAVDRGSLCFDLLCACQCGGTVFSPFMDCDRFGLPFAMELCLGCGLLCTDPVISPGSLAAYYEGHYHPMTFGREGTAAGFYFKKGQGKLVYERLPRLNPRPITVLEIGAGPGHVLAEFRARAAVDGITAECVAAEFREDDLKACREKNITAVRGSVDELRDYGGAFDVIILSHVFEHVIDLRGFLEKLKILLKNSGLVYIEVPGILELHSKAEYNFALVNYFTHSHCYHFCLDSLRRHVCGSGFKFLYGHELAYGVFSVGAQAVDNAGVASKVAAYLRAKA